MSKKVKCGKCLLDADYWMEAIKNDGENHFIGVCKKCFKDPKDAASYFKEQLKIIVEVKEDDE